MQAPCFKLKAGQPNGFDLSQNKLNVGDYRRTKAVAGNVQAEI
jgi:hypothetical protein